MKKLLLLVVACSSAVLTFAQTEGPYSGTIYSASSISGSSQAWGVSAANTGSSDNDYANFGDLPYSVGAHTEYLVVSGFGLNIPYGVIIKGIHVEIERSDPNQQTADFSIRIVKNATIGTSERATGLAYPSVDTYQSYGGESDLWGESWNYRDISDENFGIAIAASRIGINGPTSGQVDHIRITVHYQYAATLPVKLLSFGAVKSGSTVQVKWTTSEESNIDHYEVERSVNGRDFTVLGTIAASNNTSATNYLHIDAQPSKGGSWYRLRVVEQSGTAKYSQIAAIRIDNSGKNEVYPSLASHGQQLFISNAGNEQMTVRFYNTGGQMVASSTTGTGQVNASIKNAGVYYYKIVNTRNEQTGAGRIVLQ